MDINFTGALLATGVLSGVILTFFSPTPYWPEWFRLVWLTVFDDHLSVKAKKKICGFMLSAAVFWPVGILMRLIDEIALIFLACQKDDQIQPIFIIGTPRSGTTLIHRLLIQSSVDLFGITHLQWRYPSFLLHWILAVSKLDVVLGSADYWASKGNRDTKAISSMHPNLLGDYEEDAILFEERLCRHLYMYLHVPIESVYRPYSPSSRQRASLINRLGDFIINDYYSFVVRCLSGLPYNYRKRFISKEIAETCRVHSLRKRYPKSRFIVVTRKPRDFISSLKPLLSLSTMMKTDDDSHINSASWWATWERWIVEHCDQLADIHENYKSDEAFYFVNFEEFSSNPRHIISDMIRFCAVNPRDDFNNFMADFESRQKSRQKGYSYSIIDISHLNLKRYNANFYQ